jgi:hypothetical protein
MDAGSIEMDACAACYIHPADKLAHALIANPQYPGRLFSVARLSSITLCELDPRNFLL